MSLHRAKNGHGSTQNPWNAFIIMHNLTVSHTYRTHRKLPVCLQMLTEGCSRRLLQLAVWRRPVSWAIHERGDRQKRLSVLEAEHAGRNWFCRHLKGKEKKNERPSSSFRNAYYCCLSSQSFKPRELKLLHPQSVVHGESEEAGHPFISETNGKMKPLLTL